MKVVSHTRNVLGALLILSCGCMSSYRYSVKVKSYPPAPMGLGDFSVQAYDIANKHIYPMNLFRREPLDLAIGESGYSRKECPPITLRMKAGKSIVTGEDGVALALNRLSLGIFPFTRRSVSDIYVSVLEGGELDPKRDFAIQLEAQDRFTPLGLWPFLPETDGDKCCAVAICSGQNEEESISAFNLVLGWGLLSGLTAGFEKGEL